jgi:hypothetical protein
VKESAGEATSLYRQAHGKSDGGLKEDHMPELPESVPKVPFAVAVGMVLVGLIAIVFAGGSAAIIWPSMLLVLVGGGIATKLGIDLWRATE